MEGITMFLLGKVKEVGFIVLVVEEDIRPLVAAEQDMVKDDQKMNPRFSHHGEFLPKKHPPVNTLFYVKGIINARPPFHY